MAIFDVADVDGVGTAPLGHFDRGLTTFEYIEATGAYTWEATGLPGYYNVLNGTELSMTHPTGGGASGTLISWILYAPDGSVAASITGVTVPFEHFLDGTTTYDPSLGEYQLLWGLRNLLLGDDTILGSSFQDGLDGYSGGDEIDGGDGDDSLHGMAGADTIDGGEGADQLSGGNGNDDVSGGFGNDRIWGGDASTSASGWVFVAGFDTLNGGAGDDEILAQAGWSYPGGEYSYIGGGVIDGGEGNDVLYANFSHIGSDVFLDLRDPAAQQNLIDGSSIVNVERVYLSLGDGDDTLFDGSLNDRIWMGAGDDTFHFGGGGENGSTVDMGAGDDVVNWGSVTGNLPSSHGGYLSGGEGYDRLYIDWSGLEASPLSEFNADFEEVHYTGTANSDYLQSSDVDQLILANGGGGNDTLIGSGAADILNGGLGTDVLAGNEGDDSYIVDESGDVVHESVSNGFDRVYASSSYSLGLAAHVEELRTISDGSTNTINLTGNGFANKIAGNAGANILDGKGGIDTMAGYGGNDTYYVDHASDQVYESLNKGTDKVLASVSYALRTGSHVEELRTISDGSTNTINLTGNAYAQKIAGNAGANKLDGKGGIDTMAGYGGNDTYHVDHASDVVYESLNMGTDKVLASVSYALRTGSHVEELRTISDGSTNTINLTGNAYAQKIAGNAGANKLDGKGGNDTMAGYGGNDTYYVDHASDQVYESLNKGTDKILASVSYTLASTSHVEELRTTNDAGTGAINLTGNGFANKIAGNAGANILKGDAGADVLAGYDGNDTLHGGLGNDTMYGHADNDVFVFDTALGASNVDKLMSFSTADDRIWLDDAIFTQAGAVGDLAGSAFQIGAAANDAFDRIIYDSANGNLFYDADGNGAGAAVQFASIGAGLALTASDFEVV